YRDIRDLVLSGVPIEGEAGVGYVLRKGFDLPPLMFTRTEVEALVLGMRAVTSWADPELAAAAQSALDRISLALPDTLRERLAESRLYAPGFIVDTAVVERLRLLRGAVDERNKEWMAYRDAAEADTDRTVRPLALAFYSNRGTLVAWGERGDTSRASRRAGGRGLRRLREGFQQEPGRTMGDYVALMREEEARHEAERKRA